MEGSESRPQDRFAQDLRTLEETMRNAAAIASRLAAAVATHASPALPVLTPKRVAASLGVSERAVLRQIHLGKIPAAKHSGRWVVLCDDFVAQLRANAARQLPPIARGA